MKRNGFTLVELLGVILVMAAICLVVFPPIINEIKESKGKIDDATLDLIYTGADMYVDANQNDFPKINGNVYCVTLQKLVDSGNLKEPLKNMKTNENIPLSKNVKVKVKNQKYDYELVDSSDCTPSN